MRATAVTGALGLEVPVVQAPMGGGPTTPALVAAVSDAGGLGSVAAGYLPAARLEDELSAVRRLTSRPFAVNLFAATGRPATPEELAAARAVLDPLRRQFGLPGVDDLSVELPDLAEQVAVIESDRPAVVSFTFGLLPAPLVDRLHAAGCVLMGTATTVDEAVALHDAGIDWVCAQGSEAGAHRGTFLGDEATGAVGTVALVPQVCDAVPVPVIAAGGIMDGRGLAAVLVLGASAAQLGTAYLRCPEAGTPAPWRRALASAGDTSTALSAAVTGRTARGIRNRLMSLLEAVEPRPPYPALHAMTADLRRAAAAADDPELMSLWCGQGVRLGHEQPAGDLTRRIAEQAAGLLPVADRSPVGPGRAR
jgi:nitronate monooxygenase